ncbi:hypothetical protein AM1BK_36770 [Neobacillus kokaensis]|uniref:Uncharacterized protein n=1 Tax=Neobacillus kokaensis TaxID=2759023 RepID=A0ABQ3N634_9BACI|nr:hypothetical protein AM1BK_36770 [Neobacillus kokaensis]
MLRCNKLEDFNAVIIYTSFRDVCLVIYEINKNILGTVEELPFAIREFRNKIKLFEKGGNQKVYHQIIQQHLVDYKDYTDNIGFYLNDNGQAIGSTIYPEYLLRRLQYLKEPTEEDKPEIFNFAREVGSELQRIINIFEREIPSLLQPNVNESKFIEVQKSRVTYKDVNHSKLFNGDESSNVFKYRLILILQEAFAIQWIHEIYNINIINRDTIDEYFLFRFTINRFDSIVDSLINLQKFSTVQFDELNISSAGKLNKLLEDYMVNDFEAVAELRNTLHYDDVKNFYDYFVEIDSLDGLNALLTINNKIYQYIDDFLEISSISSTPLIELIIKSLFSNGL